MSDEHNPTERAAAWVGNTLGELAHDGVLSPHTTDPVMVTNWQLFGEYVDADGDTGWYRLTGGDLTVPVQLGLCRAHQMLLEEEWSGIFKSQEDDDG